MISSAPLAAPRSREPAATPRAPRRSPVPDAPSYSRRELEVLEEVEGPLGFVLWRVISDVLVWARASAPERAGLLRGGGAPVPLMDEGLAAAGSAAEDLRALSLLDAGADPARVAASCTRVAEWAEEEDFRGAALQFGELAAWALPESPQYATAAGRFCRRRREHERAKLWVRRALRLARLAGDEVAFSDAHRQLGFALMDEGRWAAAEPHYWKSLRAARRQGRTSLAGAAYHNLLVCAVHLERWDDAFELSHQAIEHYKVGYPSLPELAHDVGFFWSRLGYHSSAIPLFEEAIELIPRTRDRVLSYACLARSGAVVRDNLRFQRCGEKALALVDERSVNAPIAYYHLAEGARCFEDWTRAEGLAREALHLAKKWRNPTIEPWSRALLHAIRTREPAAPDVVPPEDGRVDRCRLRLMSKLRRHRTAAARPRSPVAADD